METKPKPNQLNKIPPADHCQLNKHERLKSSNLQNETRSNILPSLTVELVSNLKIQCNPLSEFKKRECETKKKNTARLLIPVTFIVFQFEHLGFPEGKFHPSLFDRTQQISEQVDYRRLWGTTSSILLNQKILE